MGKLVVFWSPWHGQAKVTASMCAVGLQCNRLRNDKVVMTHSQFDMSDLEGMFGRMDKYRRSLLYDNSGLSAAVLRFKQARLTEDAIEQCMIPVTSTGLYLLPGTQQNSGMVKESDTTDIVYTLLARDIPKYYDWTLVDTLSGMNTLSMNLIDAADVVVVTLSQNVATWEGFFDSVTPLLSKENVFFLLGGYNPDSNYNMKSFIHMNREYVTEANVGVVPYNVGYMDAISAGTVVRFFYSNEYATKKEENYYFIEETRRTADKIMLFTERRCVE